MTDDTKTALDSIEAALRDAMDRMGFYLLNIDEQNKALALIPALREQLTPGEDVQEQIDNIDEGIRQAGLVTGEFQLDDKTLVAVEVGDLIKIRKALQKPQAVDVVKQDHRECGCITCVCEDEEQCQGCGARFCSAHHKQGYLTQPTEDKTS